MAPDPIDFERNIFRSEMRITSLRLLIAQQTRLGITTLLSEFWLAATQRSVADLWRARRESK